MMKMTQVLHHSLHHHNLQQRFRLWLAAAASRNHGDSDIVRLLVFVELNIYRDQCLFSFLLILVLILGNRESLCVK